MPPSKLSACCKARMIVKGSEEGTNWYECTNCKEACDPAFTGEESDLKQCSECLTMKHIASGTRCARCEQNICSVCHKSLGKGVRGTCLCLPSHGSWHLLCDPHERNLPPKVLINKLKSALPGAGRKTNEMQREVMEREWWGYLVESYLQEPKKDLNALDTLCVRVIAEATRRSREETIEKIEQELYGANGLDEKTIRVILSKLKEGE